MSPLKLTPAQVRSFVLRKQGLLERLATPEAAADVLVAVQSQYPASVPAGLAARAHGVKARALDRHFLRGSWKRGWNLRATLHAATAPSHELLVDAIGPIRFARYRRWMSMSGLSEEQLEARHHQIERAIGDGHLARPELHDAVPELKALEWAGWGADVSGLAYLGRLGLAVQNASRTRFRCYEHPASRSQEDALQELLGCYLRGYGPATVKDFAYWTGITQAQAKAAFQRKGLVPTLVEGIDGTHYVLEEDVASFEGEEVPDLRLLPKFDALIMTRNDKSLWLENRYRDRVVRPAAQIEAVVLVRGRVAGTWRAKRTDERLTIEVMPFGRAPSLPAAEREARRIARAFDCKSLEVSLSPRS